MNSIFSIRYTSVFCLPKLGNTFQWALLLSQTHFLQWLALICTSHEIPMLNWQSVYLPQPYLLEFPTWNSPKSQGWLHHPVFTQAGVHRTATLWENKTKHKLQEDLHILPPPKHPILPSSSYSHIPTPKVFKQFHGRGADICTADKINTKNAYIPYHLMGTCYISIHIHVPRLWLYG